MNEPGRRRRGYLYFWGRREVFSPKGPKGVVEISFLCIFLLHVFSGSKSDFRLEGETSHPKGLMGSDPGIPSMLTYEVSLRSSQTNAIVY